MLKEQFLPTEFKFKENPRIAGMNVNPKIVKRIEAPFLINRLHIIGWEKNNFRSRCEKREVSVRFLSHFTEVIDETPFADQWQKVYRPTKFSIFFFWCISEKKKPTGKKIESWISLTNWNENSNKKSYQGNFYFLLRPKMSLNYIE